MLDALVLSALIARCAPTVGAFTMRAVIERESRSEPFAIHDNSSRRSYEPRERAQAVRMAMALLARGDDLDIGYMQLNVANLRASATPVRFAFEPCTNIRIGAAILHADYRRASARYGAGQVALARALSAYNGGTYGMTDYARAVFAEGRTLRHAVAQSTGRP